MQPSDLANNGLNYLANILNQGIAWLVAFAMLIAVIMVIVSGIKFMIAGGDEEKRHGAKRTLIFALVGVAVVILAQSMVQTVINFFGV
ncbi:MAG: hypothetical protein Q8Q39_03570 [bacterium]|nr:hypothetical protein [bacterium]